MKIVIVLLVVGVSLLSWGLHDMYELLDYDQRQYTEPGSARLAVKECLDRPGKHVAGVKTEGDPVLLYTVTCREIKN